MGLNHSIACSDSCRAPPVLAIRTLSPALSTFASPTTVRAQRTGRFDMNGVSIEQDGTSASAGTSAPIDEYDGVRRRTAATPRGLERSAHVDHVPRSHLERPTAISSPPSGAGHRRWGSVSVIDAPPVTARASATQRHERRVAGRDAAVAMATTPAAITVPPNATLVPQLRNSHAITSSGQRRDSAAMDAAHDAASFLRYGTAAGLTIAPLSIVLVVVRP